MKGKGEKEENRVEIGERKRNRENNGERVGKNRESE